mgnify:CR=1 FL=1
MKALVLTGVKKFEIQNMPTPQIEPDEVLINTAYAGVCGTDHDLYDGRRIGRCGAADRTWPRKFWHRCCGRR